MTTCKNCMYYKICDFDANKYHFRLPDNSDNCNCYKDHNSVIYTSQNNYTVGDICVYSFDDDKNKSKAIVEIVNILDDKRGLAEIKFLKVFVDDTGNDMFSYLLKSEKTMAASLKYLKNIVL